MGKVLGTTSACLPCLSAPTVFARETFCLYTNCVHLPCWPHLFAKVPEAVFDAGVLTEQAEFHRLVQLLFARSPFWRTKWYRYQKAAVKKWKDVHEQLPDELKQRHEKERPAPVKSVVRPTDTRWASQFDACKYWRGRISAFKKFLSEMLQDLSDPPPTAQALLALLTDAVRLTALKVQIAFTCESMQPIYDLILSFQKQTGGPADPLGALNDIKSAQAEVTRGKFPPGVQKLLSACPAPQAAAQSKVLQQAATVMSSKVDNLHAKTIKGRGKTQAAVNCFNPELLQTKEMMSYSELCKHIPNVPQSEWVRYIALPAPSPLPDSTAARVAWWHAKKDDFPVLSSIAVFFVRRPRSACHVERTFSLMGHIQTKDRLHMGNDTLRHLTMMYVNKPTTDDPDGESD